MKFTEYLNEDSTSCPQCGKKVNHSTSATKIGCSSCKTKATRDKDPDAPWKWTSKK